MRALKKSMWIAVPSIYFTLVPLFIVKYGMDNHIRAFDNGAPFHEVFSVFTLTWFIGHLAAAFFIWVIWEFIMFIYEEDS